MNYLKLKNRVAVITGGSSGIGPARSKLFQANGAHVAIIGQNAQKSEEASRAIGSETLGTAANATRVCDLKSIMDSVKKKWRRIDILLASAGICHCPPIEKTDEATFDPIVGINLKGVSFAVTEAFHDSPQTPQ